MSTQNFLFLLCGRRKISHRTLVGRVFLSYFKNDEIILIEKVWKFQKDKICQNLMENEVDTRENLINLAYLKVLPIDVWRISFLKINGKFWLIKIENIQSGRESFVWISIKLSISNRFFMQKSLSKISKSVATKQYHLHKFLSKWTQFKDK